MYSAHHLKNVPHALRNVGSQADGRVAPTARTGPSYAPSEARSPSEPHGTNEVANGSTYFQSDRFLERELIGRGGMGSVVRAYDVRLQRDVAVKVLTLEASHNETEVERLAEEARVMARLEHPHIVPVYELGNDDRGARFLCMKLVEGETLEHTLRWAGLGRLELPMLTDLLKVFLKVCDAMIFAHSRGIVHRDIKPSNIMIGDFGQVYVLDWGIARSVSRWPATDEQACGRHSDPLGALVGTPCYMAPEQLRGLHNQVDERTDVFALGATLYQILTGQPPRLSDDLPAMRIRKTPLEILPPQQIVDEATVPCELAQIALRAMSEDPADRFACVRELQVEVLAWIEGRLPIVNQTPLQIVERRLSQNS